jgi:hypothetical protein
VGMWAVDTGRPVRWSVGGETLPPDASGNAFWPLRLGTWQIDATDGTRHDRVTIRVVSRSPSARTPFSRL